MPIRFIDEETEQNPKRSIRFVEDQQTPEPHPSERGSIEKSLFPLASAEAVEGPPSLKRTAVGLGKAGLDVLTLPTRAAATLTGQSMSDPNAYALKPFVEKKVFPAIEKAAPLYSEKTALPMSTPGAFGTPYRPSSEGVKGIAEFIGATLSDPTLIAGGLKKLAGKKVGKAATKLDKIAGEIAEWTTGTDEAALRLAGTKGGRDVLKGAYNTQAEVGAKLVDMIDNAYYYMPGMDKIDDALKKTPAVNIVPIAKKLENAIPNPKTTEMIKVAEKLKDKANNIRKMSLEYGDAGYVPAIDMFELRKELDVIIDDAYGKQSDRYITALKEIRHDIKDEIVKNAKNTKYEPIMNELSKKVDSVEKMKKLVGHTSESRELRSESFIRNILNKGKTKSKEWLKDFEDIFGGDFVEQAQLAKWAEQIGGEGAGGILPRWTTGRSLWAKGAGLAVGSPRLASRYTLPTTSKIASAGRSLGESKLPKELLPKAGVRAAAVSDRTRTNY